MQIDPCLLCGEPALDRYRIGRFDPLRLETEELHAPLCEPHRAWLETAGGRGRADAAGVRWRLLEQAPGG